MASSTLIPVHKLSTDTKGSDCWECGSLDAAQGLHEFGS